MALTIEDFIDRAKKVHGNKYDYSKVEYINNRTKICIICPKHGEFWQTPNVHLDGSGCRKCFNEKRGQTVKLTKAQFIERAKKVHGDRYDYSKVDYKNIMSHVCIICPEHGEFWQTPNDHINSKHKCPKCSHRHDKKTGQEFIEEARKIHGDKYDYSQVEYYNQNTRVCIICPEHGEFWQTPKVHLTSKYACPICGKIENGLKRRINYIDFIERAKKIHNNKYDYSKAEYTTTDKKICIICPEHGEFWQTPHNHINQKQGCPFCNESHLCKTLKEFLIENKIDFEQEKGFQWLRYKKPLKLDFFLPKFNVAIECHGDQHFEKFRWEKDDKQLLLRQKRDNIKKQLCEEHNIPILYYANRKHTEDLITDASEIISLLKNI